MYAKKSLRASIQRCKVHRGLVHRIWPPPATLSYIYMGKVGTGCIYRRQTKPTIGYGLQSLEKQWENLETWWAKTKAGSNYIELLNWIILNVLMSTMAMGSLNSAATCWRNQMCNRVEVSIPAPYWDYGGWIRITDLISPVPHIYLRLELLQELLLGLLLLVLPLWEQLQHPGEQERRGRRGDRTGSGYKTSCFLVFGDTDFSDSLGNVDDTGPARPLVFFIPS